MIAAELGKTSFILEENGPNPGLLTIVRHNAEGTTRFYVPRALFERYAERRIEDIGRKLIAEVIKR